jgi:hypothetical protein
MNTEFIDGVKTAKVLTDRNPVILENVRDLPKDDLEDVVAHFLNEDISINSTVQEILKEQINMSV